MIKNKKYIIRESQEDILEKVNLLSGQKLKIWRCQIRIYCDTTKALLLKRFQVCSGAPSSSNLTTPVIQPFPSTEFR
jgi:hypothetical protein